MKKENKENKVRASVTKEVILISTENNAGSQTVILPGEVVRLTAKEIFGHMSVDPAGLMLFNPAAPSISDDERMALDELFSMFKNAALSTDDISVAENCLEILSSPFGLLHPRRNESVYILKEATKIPQFVSFANQLITGSKIMLNEAISNRHTDEETKRVARDLLQRL
jgi:hypothetical protein